MTRSVPLLIVTTALALVMSAGCADGGSPVVEPEFTRAPNVVQGAAPGEEGRVLGPDETPTVATAPHTPADVSFVQGMVHHHAQALIMIDMIEGRSDDAALALFAERMDVTQVAELEVMETWLTDRGEDVPRWEAMRLELGLRLSDGHGGEHGDDHDGGHSGHEDSGMATMPGMLTDAELAELAAARGDEFDRLWLEGMTRHHAGALEMVRRLYADGGGQEREVATMASHIDSDQAIEMDRMATLLAAQ